MTCKYELVGDDMQAVVMTIEPGQTLRAEAGALMFMTESIHMESTLAGKQDAGLLGGLMSGVKRLVSGDSFFVTQFSAQGQPGRVAFSAPYPGKIIPMNLNELGPMICQRDSFLCADASIDITIAFTKRLGAGFFGGEGFILQRLVGAGEAFIHSGGAIIPMDLAAGETVRVDTGCLVAFQESVTYDIQMVKGLKSIFFAGEGLFFATLKGPGRVYLQTLPFGRMADRIIAAANLGGGEESKGVGGLGGKVLQGMISGN